MNACFISAKHRASWHPSWALWRKGGCGRRGRLRHLYGDSLREADWQLLLRRPGHPDRTEEVSSGLSLFFTVSPFLFLFRPRFRSSHLISPVQPVRAAHAY